MILRVLSRVRKPRHKPGRGSVPDNAVDFVHFNFLFCIELRFDNRFWSVGLNWFFDVKDRFGKGSILENAF